MSNFDDYAWLATTDEAAKILESFAGDGRPELQQLSDLRKTLPAERARLAVELAALRRRATEKFGPLAAKLFFTPVQLEQATDRDVAAWKAQRLEQIGAGRLAHDYCCGIGGDLLALAAHGPVIGWDLSPIVALYAQRNLVAAKEEAGERFAASSQVRTGDVADLTPDAGETWHVDPDRRADGRRSTTLEYHFPGPEIIARWRQAAPEGCVKLAPASEPPAVWQAEGELEWITSRRECRQLVAWFGGLAQTPGMRRATVVTASSDEGLHRRATAASFSGDPNVPCPSTDQPRRFVYDPDPAIVAARLVGAIANRYDLATLGPGAAYLTGDEAIDDPLLSPFEVLETAPLRPRDIASWLAARGIGRVELKQRGVAVDLERFRRDLKLRGDGEATLVLTRCGKKQLAIIAQRIKAN